ncbi:ribonuclease toxin immunity protein CdiI [Enterococcus sp. LJL128]
MSKLITEKKLIDDLMKSYFFVVRNYYFKEALRKFSEKQGFGVGYASILFLDDLDEEDFEIMTQNLDGEHILLDMESPQVDEDCEAYISFTELYNYLDNRVKEVIDEQPEEREELLDLLKEVKRGLNL